MGLSRPSMKLQNHFPSLSFDIAVIFSFELTLGELMNFLTDIPLPWLKCKSFLFSMFNRKDRGIYLKILEF